MLYYLDTVVVIYAVEGNPADQQRALNHPRSEMTSLFSLHGRFAGIRLRWWGRGSVLSLTRDGFSQSLSCSVAQNRSHGAGIEPSEFERQGNQFIHSRRHIRQHDSLQDRHVAFEEHLVRR